MLPSIDQVPTIRDIPPLPGSTRSLYQLLVSIPFAHSPIPFSPASERTPSAAIPPQNAMNIASPVANAAAVSLSPNALLVYSKVRTHPHDTW